jgi:hypothetical protein
MELMMRVKYTEEYAMKAVIHVVGSKGIVIKGFSQRRNDAKEQRPQ